MVSAVQRQADKGRPRSREHCEYIRPSFFMSCSEPREPVVPEVCFHGVELSQHGSLYVSLLLCRACLGFLKAPWPLSHID